MTSENLLKYLKDPDNLYQVSFQELKSLVAEYPYSLSIRYLFAMKCKQDNLPEFDRQLQFLSAYAIDRPHIYDVFNNNHIRVIQQEENFVLHEDYLELKELSTLEQELEERKAAATPPVVISKAAVPPPTIEPVVEPEPVLVQAAVPQQPTSDMADEAFYSFDLEIDSGMENVGELAETSTNEAAETPKASIIDIDDLFNKKSTAETDSLDSTTSNTNEEEESEQASETAHLDTLAGGNYPDIPLEVFVPSDEDEILSEVMEQDEEIFVEEEVPTDTTAESQTDAGQVAHKHQGPLPKEAFSTWTKVEEAMDASFEFSGFDLVGFNSKGMVSELVSQQQPIPVAATPVKESSPLSEIDDSSDDATDQIVIEQDIASETLAQLLVLKGHFADAKAMYEQLSLIFPEKSSYFAAEIEKINNVKEV